MSDYLKNYAKSMLIVLPWMMAAKLVIMAYTGEYETILVLLFDVGVMTVGAALLETIFKHVRAGRKSGGWWQKETSVTLKRKHIIAAVLAIVLGTGGFVLYRGVSGVYDYYKIDYYLKHAVSAAKAIQQTCNSIIGSVTDKTTDQSTLSQYEWCQENRTSVNKVVSNYPEVKAAMLQSEREKLGDFFVNHRHIIIRVINIFVGKPPVK